MGLLYNMFMYWQNFLFCLLLILIICSIIENLLVKCTYFRNAFAANRPTIASVIVHRQAGKSGGDAYFQQSVCLTLQERIILCIIQIKSTGWAKK